MALIKQNSPTPSRVNVDFPDMPRLPKMKIPDDHAAMQAHQAELDRWYGLLKQTMLDKLSGIQSQVDNLKKG